MKKQRKLQRKKSIDKEELNISCRALGKADHEGWLYKKGMCVHNFRGRSREG